MSLKLGEGGSQVIFRQDVKCCIRSCGATKEVNRTLPFYSFPRSAEQCKEWLRQIRLEDDAVGNLDKLHLTHAVCSVHFKSYEGGMKLYVAKSGPLPEVAKSATNSAANVVCMAPDSTKPSKSSIETQTYDLDWIISLKQDYSVEIICNESVQCRVCASTSVPAMSIYDKRNEKLNLEALINNMLPINVKPTDAKPLNICVKCVFKLEQFIHLFNCCNMNDKNFNSSSSKPNQPKSSNQNPPNNNISNDDNKIACIYLSDEENNISKSNETSNDQTEEIESIEISKNSRLNNNTSNSNKCIKKKSSNQNPSNNNISNDDNEIACICLSDDENNISKSNETSNDQTEKIESIKISTNSRLNNNTSNSNKCIKKKNGSQNPPDNEKNNDDSKIGSVCLSDDENNIDNSKNASDDHNEKLKSIELSKNSKLNKNTSNSNNYIKKKNSNQNPSDNKNNDDSKIPCIYLSDEEIGNNENKKTSKEKLNKNISYPSDFIKMESRKHKIKILVSNKNNKNRIQTITAVSQNEPPQCSSDNNKVIDVEFVAKYIICHGREWIHEINVDEEQLDYSQETIDHVLKVIQCTMKKQCKQNNSKVVPLPIPPSKIGRVVASKNPQQLRTVSVIIDSKNHVNDEVRKKAAEMLKKKKPLKKCWICINCGLTLDDRPSFRAHIKYNHPKPCRFCGENIAPLDKLLIHEREHRDAPSDGFICHLCGRQFKSRNSLSNHCRKHKKSEQMCCNTCNLQFINGFGLRKHIRQHHKEQLVKKNPEDILKERQKCPKCGLWLSSKLSLRVHLKTHLPIEERKKTCPDCNKVFINVRRFKLHLETHGPCPFKCPECHRSYPSQEHLDNHLHCHKVTDPVNCDICKQCFKTRTTLKNHINRVHQGVHYVQKTFTCLFCKVVFTNNDELKMHSNTHTSEEKAQAFAGDDYGKLQCNECDKFFLYKSRLSMHKMYHHSSPCVHCGKHVADNLTNHYCKPRGTRALQFCCQYCTKRFSSKQRLNLHERTHGLDYRFQCTFCSKWFTKMSALKTHSYTHSNTRQYICNLCGKMCKLLSSLKRHFKICHNNKSEENNVGNLSPNHIQDTVTLPTADTTRTTQLTLPLNIPIALPITDEQGYLICDVSNRVEVPNHINGHHIDISSRINIPNHIDVPDQQLQSVEMEDLQNLYIQQNKQS